MRNIIRSLSLFKNLNSSQIDKLYSISIVQNYSKNSILFYEKDRTDRLIFLINGLAKAYKIDKYNNEIFLYFIEKDMIISQIDDLTSDSMFFFSNISSIETSSTLTINYKLFKKNFLDSNILTLEFANRVLYQSNRMRLLIDREFIFDAVSKVAMILGDDLNRFNRLKRHDIALILHIQPATLSRVLSRLKRDSIITIEQGIISIINRDKLEKIYKN